MIEMKTNSDMNMNHIGHQAEYRDTQPMNTNTIVLNSGYKQVYMSHGQYLVYSSKSYFFEECIIVFQVLVCKQMLSFFEECSIAFRAPAQFQKNTNTTLH